jgi:hypothetical protein
VGELVQKGQVSENRNPITLISGGNVVGLMTAGALTASGQGFAKREKIAFHVAVEEPGTSLCIRLRSRDDDYHGNVDFAADAASAGWHSIAFPTGHADYLSALEADEFLVSAFIGPDCDELYPDRVSFVPVSLTSNDPGPLYLLANTRNNDAVIVGIYDDGREEELACEPVDSEMSRSIFQRKCLVGDPNVPRLLVESSDGFGDILWREEIHISWPDHGD